MRKVLIIAFAAFALMCGGLWSLAVWRDLQQTLERAEMAVLATAQLMRTNATRAIEAGDAFSLSLQNTLAGWDLRDETTGRALWRQLTRQMAATPQISSFWVLDAQGYDVMENWNYTPVSSGSFAHREYFQAHQGKGVGLYIEPMHTGTVSGKRRFTLSRAIRDDHGALQAVVVVGVYSDAFAEPFQDQMFGLPGHFFLVTQEAKLLASWPPDTSTPPDSLLATRTAAALQRLGDGNATLHRSALLDANGVITAVQRLSRLPAAVITEVDIATVLKPWLWRSLLSGLIATGALLGFAILVRIGLRSAAGEAAAKRELRTINQELDQRVRDRTAALERALHQAGIADAAKGKFLATISHDLRQPLQGLSLFVDLAIRITADARLRQLGEMTMASLQAGRRLLDDLVDLAQLESGVARIERGRVRLEPLLNRLMIEALPAARAKGLKLRLAPTHQAVLSDPLRLQQIIQNLLSNAIKYTTRGGILLGCRRTGNEVRIEIWDTGPGISDEHLHLIFEEFYQVDNPARNNARGVGLGLAIVDRTARLLEHRLVVRSQVGKGSMFAVIAPRDDSIAQPAATEERRQARAG